MNYHEACTDFALGFDSNYHSNKRWDGSANIGYMSSHSFLALLFLAFFTKFTESSLRHISLHYDHFLCRPHTKMVVVELHYLGRVVVPMPCC